MILNSTRAGVVFDMDGLLLDSERVSQEVLVRTGQVVGVPLTKELARNLIGRNMVDGQRYLRELISNDTLLESFLHTCDRLYQEEWENGCIPLKSGVREILDTLDDLSIPRAVATSTRRHIAVKKLAKVNVLSRFHHIVGGDEVQNGKPAPDIYLKACDCLDVDASHSMACEDSPAGIEAAHRAGLRGILIPDLIPPTEQMRQHAWKIVSSLHDVIPIVRELARPS